MIQIWNKKINFLILVALFLLFFCIPVFTFASNHGFVPLVGIPGIDETTRAGIKTYIDTLLKIAIVAAAFIAVVRLVLAGAKYVLHDVVTSKEEAKKDIRSALLGLLIVLAAVTILRTINPDLLTFPSITKIEPVQPPPLPAGSIQGVCKGDVLTITASGSVTCIPPPAPGTIDTNIVTELPPADQNFFAGNTTVSASIRADLRHPLFNEKNLNITVRNFTTRVKGVREVSQELVDNNGGIVAFKNGVVKPSCPESDYILHQSRTGRDSYIFYCINK